MHRGSLMLARDVLHVEPVVHLSCGDVHVDNGISRDVQLGRSSVEMTSIEPEINALFYDASDTFEGESVLQTSVYDMPAVELAIAKVERLCSIETQKWESGCSGAYFLVLQSFSVPLPVGADMVMHSQVVSDEDAYGIEVADMDRQALSALSATSSRSRVRPVKTMKVKDAAFQFCSQALSCMAEVIIASLSFVTFTVLDLADRFLCVVFWALDSILDPGSGPCYCKRRLNGTLPEKRSQPLHAKDLPGSLCNSVQLKYVARSGNTAEPAGCNQTPYIAEFVHPLNERGDLSIHDQNVFGNYGFENPPSELKNAVIKNKNSNCASVVQHTHMLEKVQLSSLQWNTHDRPSPRCSKVLSGGNSLTTSFEGSEHFSRPVVSRWSDCSCSTCTTWQADEKESLYVHVEGQGHENVVFIHGFLSSSLLWSEKVIPYFSDTAEATYRLFAVDLLGFGKSPKPTSCHYTMADHIKKIEEFVLHRYKIESFHLVAHSMGCLVALALAAAHVDSIKTITLVAPPYFPAPANESGPSYVLRQVAPRRIWPLTAFGASVMSWYEHVGRGVCFFLCKQHLTWEYVIGFLTLNRISRAAVRDFMQHTHHSAWHIFHNVICGEAHAMDGYLFELERAGCIIHALHGKEDKVVPVHCSYQLQKRYPTLKLQIVNGANHFTIIYGRENVFSSTLDNIWRMENLITKECRKW
ncbi:hypothetical protein L7F22_041661 [Adiantum nelumboides]|nr:hypothetical protein [Adiantum nelumboides]